MAAKKEDIKIPMPNVKAPTGRSKTVTSSKEYDRDSDEDASGLSDGDSNFGGATDEDSEPEFKSHQSRSDSEAGDDKDRSESDDDTVFKGPAPPTGKQTKPKIKVLQSVPEASKVITTATASLYDSSKVSKDATLEELLIQDKEETKQAFKLRRDLTVKLAKEATLKFDPLMAVRAGYLLANKVRVGVQYSPEVEEVVKDLLIRLR